jgi:HK97 family phage prohead protease
MQLQHIKAPFEIKSLDEGGKISGYASVFGTLDSDGDVIVKGAFRDTLAMCREKGKYPKMLWQHDPSIIVGKWTDMIEDDHGLKVEGHFILDVEKGREGYALAKAGVLDSLSVGFNTQEAERGEMRGRVITKVDLWEVSCVTWGANPDAKFVAKALKTERDFERFLRDAGYSRKEATAITADGFKALSQRDAGDDVPMSRDTLEALQTLTAKMKGLINV